MAFWLPLLSGLGSLFGGMGAARDQAKQQQGNLALDQYKTELGGWQAQQQARNTQADQMAARPTQRLQQGALGNMIEGWTPSSVSWGGAGSIPKISGGFSDLKFNDTTQQQAQLMQRDALARQMLSLIHDDVPSAATWGALLGTGYVLGELPNSFLKRQLGIAPGDAARGWAGPLFWIVDQIDSLAGVLIVMPLAWIPPRGVVVLLIGVALTIHPAVARVMVALGLKRRVG